MSVIAKNKITVTTLTVSATVVLIIGVLAITPLVLAGRSYPVTLGGQLLLGLTPEDRAGILAQHQQQIAAQSVTFALAGYSATHTLDELGVTIDQAATNQSISGASLMSSLTGSDRQITPTIVVDRERLDKQLHQDFVDQIESPINASLTIDSTGKIISTPSRAGEGINLNIIEQAIIAGVEQGRSNNYELPVVTQQPAVQDHEVDSARQFADLLLKDGLNFVFAEQTFNMKPFTIKRLLTFAEQVDPVNPKNHILGVKLDSVGLHEYLTTTIAPEIDRAASNARFKIAEGSDEAGNIRVEQFSLPEQGQQLNIERTASHIAAKLYQQQNTIPLAVDVTTPDISSLADIEKFGITELVASGVSDFQGSPQNRAHNIGIGSSRYDGLLIPPGAEFSFNEHLGPVSAATGFKPELVIKSNVTVPEYGGGLCQVSTSMFRVALNAGLEITKRRNHSYAVQYYGKPGLDATIYPPYTDLRFRNNTPGYLLIQTRLEGTKLAFDMWGTKDGREVQIDGPHTYDHGPDGSVKAWVAQKVVINDQPVIEETFYSRYKSPKLFPKILAANGESD